MSGGGVRQSAERPGAGCRIPGVGLWRLLAPEGRHLLEGLALGLGNRLPDEEGREKRHEGVDAVGAPDAPAAQRREGGRDEEVRDPLRRHGDGHGLRADGVGEDFRDEHPADGSPRHHERGRVEDDEDERRKADGVGEREHGEGQHANHHSRGANHQQRLASHAVDREDGHHREDDVDDAHDHRLEHRRVARGSHVGEDARRVVEHHVDADGLLEEREQDAYHDDLAAVGEEAFAPLVDRRLDVGQNRARLRGAVDALQNGEGLLVAALECQEARCLGDEQDEQQEGAGREGLREEHAPPADGDHRLLDGFGRIAQIVADEVVDEVDDQHAEDDGELVARDERAADARRRDFGDVHRAQGRGQADAHAADDAVEVERDEQCAGGFAVGQDAAFGPPRPDGRDEEEHGGQDERALAPQARGAEARDGAAEDAAQQGARGGEAVEPGRVGEVPGRAEELVEGLFGARDDGRVVAEEQTADDGDQHDGEQVGAAPRFGFRGHVFRVGLGVATRFGAARRPPAARRGVGRQGHAACRETHRAVRSGQESGGSPGRGYTYMLTMASKSSCLPLCCTGSCVRA